MEKLYPKIGDMTWANPHIEGLGEAGGKFLGKICWGTLLELTLLDSSESYNSVLP